MTIYPIIRGTLILTLISALGHGYPSLASAEPLHDFQTLSLEQAGNRDLRLSNFTLTNAHAAAQIAAAKPNPSTAHDGRR